MLTTFATHESGDELAADPHSLARTPFLHILLISSVLNLCLLTQTAAHTCMKSDHTYAIYVLLPNNLALLVVSKAYPLVSPELLLSIISDPTTCNERLDRSYGSLLELKRAMHYMYPPLRIPYSFATFNAILHWSI